MVNSPISSFVPSSFINLSRARSALAGVIGLTAIAVAPTATQVEIAQPKPTYTADLNLLTQHVCSTQLPGHSPETPNVKSLCSNLSGNLTPDQTLHLLSALQTLNARPRGNLTPEDLASVRTTLLEAAPNLSPADLATLFQASNLPLAKSMVETFKIMAEASNWKGGVEEVEGNGTGQNKSPFNSIGMLSLPRGINLTSIPCYSFPRIALQDIGILNAEDEPLRVAVCALLNNHDQVVLAGKLRTIYKGLKSTDSAAIIATLRDDFADGVMGNLERHHQTALLNEVARRSSLPPEYVTLAYDVLMALPLQAAQDYKARAYKPQQPKSPWNKSDMFASR